MNTTKRRWFRFGFLTLFVVVVALLLGLFINGRQKARQRENALTLLDQVNCLKSVGDDSDIPITWRLFGATAYEYIYFARDDLTQSQCQMLLDAFPEADVRPVSEREQWNRDSEKYNEYRENLIRSHATENSDL